jgi:hypothetical protein
LQWGKVCIDEVNCCILGTHVVGNVLEAKDLEQELESA